MSQLIQAIEKATQSDLLAINERISYHERELSSLRAIQQALREKFLVPAAEPAASVTTPIDTTTAETQTKTEQAAKNLPAESPATGGSKMGERQKKLEQRRNQVFDYLSKLGAPCGQMKLAQKLNIPTGSITKVVDHEWFEKTPLGVTIAKTK